MANDPRLPDSIPICYALPGVRLDRREITAPADAKIVWMPLRCILFTQTRVKDCFTGGEPIGPAIAAQ